MTSRQLARLFGAHILFCIPVVCAASAPLARASPASLTDGVDASSPALAEAEALELGASLPDGEDDSSPDYSRDATSRLERFPSGSFYAAALRSAEFGRAADAARAATSGAFFATSPHYGSQARFEHAQRGEHDATKCALSMVSFMVHYIADNERQA